MPTASTSRACRPILLTLSLLAAGCAKQPPAPAPAPATAPLTEWPKGASAPLKITDELTLAIPLQYERTAIEPGDPHIRAFLTQQSDRAEARFDFFLPASGGYTLENYRNEADPDKVEVAYLHAGNPHEADPDAPGEYPPNMLKRALAQSLNPDDYVDQYGLRCYREREPSARLTCYGRRNTAGEFLMLTTQQAPYPADSFPQLQVRYFSRSYGGVRIAWRTHVKNLPRWREIDAQIWTFIAAWQVAPPAAAAQPKP
ncbi:MAG TPA: hypothetical protein VNX02_08700 [Steroidobacteraceae bacterium]|jgi:hypothetical protein|nr:hypothetical protein [Steroidobacteraceae bacterium]